MSCHEYLDTLAETAFGAEPDARLRAHLAQCAHCRHELDRLAALAGAVDRGVDSIVSGEPAPGFAARVRARLAEESEQRARWWRAPVPMFAAGLAAVALVTWLVWAVVQRPGREGAPETAKEAPVAPAPQRAPYESEKETPTSPRLPKQPAVAEQAAKQAPSRRRVPVPPGREPALPEVLLAGDEWGQVARLYAMSQQGRASAEQLASPERGLLEEKFQPLTAIALLEIKPLARDDAETRQQ